MPQQGRNFEFSENDFFILFHILDLKGICFFYETALQWILQQFLKKVTTESKNEFFFLQMPKKNWFGLYKCILCSLGHMNTSKLMKND